MLIGGKSYGMCKTGNCTVAIDSGLTYMIVPLYAKDIMVSHKIPVADAVFPCKHKEQYGNIELVIGGTKY